MIKAKDLSKSTILSINKDPHRIEQIQVQTPSARGGSSLYKVRMRNMRTGQKVDQVYRGEEALQETECETREVQFLYENAGQYAFMDLSDYSQFELFTADLEEALPFLLEDMEGIKALISEERVIAVVMPDTVDMQIVECDPSIKGASATARTKPATLSTGLIIQVPEYISNGETIRIDTRNRDFVSRV